MYCKGTKIDAVSIKWDRENTNLISCLSKPYEGEERGRRTMNKHIAFRICGVIIVVAIALSGSISALAVTVGDLAEIMIGVVW